LAEQRRPGFQLNQATATFTFSACSQKDSVMNMQRQIGYEQSFKRSELMQTHAKHILKIHFSKQAFQENSGLH
jgi:hypothetical protein